MDKNGTFIISLDFELYWGVRDAVSLDRCRANILGAREVIPRILDILGGYNIHATWAVVGFLFFSSRDELRAGLPKLLPVYNDKKYSPYEYLKNIGQNENEDPCHFGLSLVKKIAAAPGQEVSSHTFGHYYSLETGQDRESFRADLRAAKEAAGRVGVEIKSVVFPRNQINPEYLPICREEGIGAVRGNENSWLYRGRMEKKQS
ncbi:MAG: polysaccharide deacetylase family protein, partial [Planctomycetes bacterium]|nr:polysaccharide deacetylase family protein [Planctomycetota bacterium]